MHKNSCLIHHSLWYAIRDDLKIEQGEFMKLVDQKTNQVIVPRIQTAYTFPKRLVGLLGKSYLPIDEGLHIKPCQSIHMFFMRFSIDAIFLDQRNKVVSLHEHVPPWSFIKPIHDAYSVVEVSAGTIQTKKISIGQWIEFL
jgi:uncharacterized membrane protein (UPF0127 family)